MDGAGEAAPPAAATVAVVTAMPSEAQHAVGDLGEARAVRFGPWAGWCGIVGRRPVAVLATGIGMVNAAAALSALLARVRPHAVLNVGCAGAHREDILPGDVVVATEVVAYGSITVLPDGTERFAGHRFDVDGVTLTPDTLAADARLLALARRAACGWQPEPWPVGAGRSPRVEFGVVASADCWTQQPSRIHTLHARHGSLCEDMEAAALAQAAAIYRVPFLAIKDVSNNELLGATDHGPQGPTLHSIHVELGRRAWVLARRTIEALGAED